MERRKQAEMILFHMEEDLEAISETGMQAFLTGNFTQAKDIAEQASQLQTLIEQVQTSLENWADLIGEDEVEEPVAFESQTSRSYTNRLEGGKCMPQEAFRIPILQALTALGGGAQRKTVFAEMEELLHDQFNSYDLEIMQGNWYTRWMNQAAWERQRMVGDGLLKDDSPRGRWEISEAGKQYLAQQKGYIPPASIERVLYRGDWYLPQQVFRMLILQAILDEPDGKSRKEILTFINSHMKDHFNDFDLEVTSGQTNTRWMEQVSWERNAMLKDGLLEKDTPRGIWKISASGRQYLKGQLKQ